MPTFGLTVGREESTAINDQSWCIPFGGRGAKRIGNCWVCKQHFPTLLLCYMNHTKPYFLQNLQAVKVLQSFPFFLLIFYSLSLFLQKKTIFCFKLPIKTFTLTTKRFISLTFYKLTFCILILFLCKNPETYHIFKRESHLFCRFLSTLHIYVCFWASLGTSEAKNMSFLLFIIASSIS